MNTVQRAYTRFSHRIRGDMACEGSQVTTIPTGDDGYIVLGPSNAREGDVLAVLLGTPSALLLRPDLAESTFRVVGECFVYGLHDGIPMLGLLSKPWSGIAAWVHGDRRVLRFLNTETKDLRRPWRTRVGG